MSKFWAYFMVVGLVVSTSCAVSAQSAANTAPEHYENPNVNPDPNFAPGDYPKPDVEAATAEFDKQVEALAPQGDVYYVSNEEEDEITWTAVKNETASVMGFFRAFDGYVSLQNAQFAKAELLIDVNSLDSAVPARDNRLKTIFFQSMKPELGTARLVLDKAVEGNAAFSALEDGAPHPLTLGGNFTLGASTVPVQAKLEVKWDKTDEIFYVRTLEPLTLFISDLKLDGNMPELMKECNHKSVGNAIKITCKLRFE